MRKEWFMFGMRFRVLVMVAVLFVLSLFVISGVSKASPSVGNAAPSQSSSASVASVHNLTITSVSPAAGSIKAGSTVTITGTGFAAGARVVFDETAATDVKVVSATEITATVPVKVKSQNVDITVFVGTEGASLAGAPKTHGSQAVVHGYKDDK
jgi:hypothetical protein